jgi:hypothetical protein
MAGKVSSTKDKSQISKFKKMARDLECDESEDALDVAIVKVAKAKPESKVPVSKKN